MCKINIIHLFFPARSLKEKSVSLTGEGLFRGFCF